MGAVLRRMFRGISEFPIQLHPICFLLQEEYTSTGDKIVWEQTQEKQDVEEGVTQTFTENLKARKKLTRAMLERHQTENIDEILRQYPGWNAMTISILHQVYLLFADPYNSTLLFNDFCACLEYLGDKSPKDLRIKFFDTADADRDGYIEYSEFLPGLYNFHPQKKKELQGMAKLCLTAAQRCQFVSSLSLGEQLENGLF